MPFRWQGRRDATHLLELPNGTISLGSTYLYVEQLESNGEIRRRDRKDVLETLFATRQRAAVRCLHLELGERIQDARIVRRVSLDLVEDRARVSRTAFE